MGTNEIIALVSIALTIIGGVWGVMSTLMARNRQAEYDRLSAMESHFAALFRSLEDKFRESRVVMWKKIDEHRDAVIEFKDEFRVEVLRLAADFAEYKGRAVNAPTAEMMLQQMLQLESRIEKRFEMQDLITAVGNKKEPKS